MRRIVYATYRRHPDPFPDDVLVVEHLKTDVEILGVSWDDKDFPWETADLVVLRSCWDYHYRPRRFFAWLDQLESKGIEVRNPVSLVRWNADKRYLRDLRDRGVSIVPTVWCHGSREDLAATLDENRWSKAVVKPLISASAHRTWVTSPDLAREHAADFDKLVADGGAMIQPFVDEVQSEGEWSLMFVGSTFTHAVLKRPIEGEFRVQFEYGGTAEPVTPPDSMVEAAERVMAAIEGPVSFARVDGVRRNGEFQLMELELIEPYMFFDRCVDAARRFAAMVEA